MFRVISGARANMLSKNPYLWYKVTVVIVLLLYVAPCEGQRLRFPVEPPAYSYYYGGQHGLNYFIVESFKGSVDSFQSYIHIQSETQNTVILRDSLYRFPNPVTIYTFNKSKAACEEITQKFGPDYFIELLSKDNYQQSLTFRNLTVHLLQSHGNSSLDMEFHNCAIKDLEFDEDTLTNLRLTFSRINRCRISNSFISRLHMESYCDSMIFNRSVFLTQPTLTFIKEPNYLEISACKLSATADAIDLDNIWIKNGIQKCILNLNGTDVRIVRFEYSKFKIDTSGLSFEQKQSLYSSLKENYLKLGMMVSYQLVDIDLIRLNYSNKGLLFKWINWINFHWWTYGYQKDKIVRNSIILFLFFLLFNTIIGLDRLTKSVYSIPGYADVLSSMKRNKALGSFKLQSFFYVALYTCLVFWGLHLDKKEIKFDNIFFTCYILVQYLVGLLCVAYFGAYILSR